MVAGSSCTSRRRAEHQTGPVQGPAPGLVPGPAVRRRTRVLAPGPALGLAPGQRPSLRSAGRAAPTVRATAPVPGAGARRRSAVQLPSRPLPSGRAPTTERGLRIFLPLSFKQRSNASCLSDGLFDFILAQALVAFIMISCMSPHLMPVEVATNFCRLLRERGSGKHRNIQSCAQCGNHFLPLFFFTKLILPSMPSMKGCNALRDKAQLHPF